MEFLDELWNLEITLGILWLILELLAEKYNFCKNSVYERGILGRYLVLDYLLKLFDRG